jgi:hypothetical protein
MGLIRRERCQPILQGFVEATGLGINTLAMIERGAGESVAMFASSNGWAIGVSDYRPIPVIDPRPSFPRSARTSPRH